MSATGHDRAYGFSLIATPHAANEQAETTKRRSHWRSRRFAPCSAGTHEDSRLETEKKRATRAFRQLRQRPKNLRACLVRAFSLLATSRRRPIKERSENASVLTHKRHRENGLRRCERRVFFFSTLLRAHCTTRARDARRPRRADDRPRSHPVTLDRDERQHGRARERHACALSGNEARKFRRRGGSPARDPYPEEAENLGEGRPSIDRGENQEEGRRRQRG